MRFGEVARSSRSLARPFALSLVLGVLVAGCTENTAPGNDREAALDPTEPAAEVADVATATEGVATDMLMPQPMTDADVRNAPAVGDRCVFRFTRVGLPVFVYGSAGVIKLNGKLVELPVAASAATTAVRRYAAGPVSVMVRPLDDAAPDGEAPDGEVVAGELVVKFAEASHELGYHGFLECGS